MQHDLALRIAHSYAGDRKVVDKIKVRQHEPDACELDNEPEKMPDLIAQLIYLDTVLPERRKLFLKGF